MLALDNLVLEKPLSEIRGRPLERSISNDDSNKTEKGADTHTTREHVTNLPEHVPVPFSTQQIRTVRWVQAVCHFDVNKPSSSSIVGGGAYGNAASPDGDACLSPSNNASNS